MSKLGGKWKFEVDNKMRDFGDTDYDRKVIRVNKSKKRNKKPGEVINTIVHELKHKNHPKMHEKTVRKETKKALAHMGQSQKQRLYNKFT